MTEMTLPYLLETPGAIVTDDGRSLAVPRAMTLAEFEAFPWPECERWELLEGVPVMSPSPIPDHQELLGELFALLRSALPQWRVMLGIDLRPPRHRSYVCPDLVVLETIGGNERPTTRTPALAVEILSSSTTRNDLGAKLALYERAGIPEYWVADPATAELTIHVLEGQGDARAYRAAPRSEAGFSGSPLLSRELRLHRQGERFRVEQG